ncbi:hypothetical protein HDC37_000659 [Microbacterium sp. AK009]|uniref:glycosyltransferase family 2 protein n=1 Tax=Microbacterium sp. AK009 TaxID=2723068 RepID=UPI0015C8E7D1|nr:glycosyltransferase family 2 protein [Microbacterium sp. AK009]NYF15847.1 hypothetical protein [Microbacterium sp. AK009]
MAATTMPRLHGTRSRRARRLLVSKDARVRIVMTLMVRDEADIVGAMLEHHKAQGVDHVIVTDNASHDGTTEILESFAADGFVTLWHDPEHRKQQYLVVTRMARHAATQERADWVINADADEFFVPQRGGASTLRDCLERLDERVQYINVPVVNLTGRPAIDGSGLERLVYRDHRSQEELNASGIPFHPTSDAVHRANPLVEIAQGNHFVTAPGWGDGADSETIEVLHLPWRSWRQYEGKVRKSGQAYEANPELFPSPRHHGMQDYRRWKAGRLEALYVAKHPSPDEIESMVASGSLEPELRLTSLGGVSDRGVREDVRYSDARLHELSHWGRQLAAVESDSENRLQKLREEQDRERALWVAHNVKTADQIDALRAEVTSLSEELAAHAARRARWQRWRIHHRTES